MDRKEEMATMTKNLKVNVRRSMVFPFKISCRLARDHPFILGMLISMNILHSYWPVLFDFLVSSSPVFICTAFLLGALLVYGEPNIHENKEARAENRTKVKEISKEKQAEGTVKVGEAGGSVKANKSDLKHQFDSSLGSSCQPLEGHDGSSGSEYDEAENSSPDASVADIIPMLDELHPTLDSEAPRSSHLSVGDSDAASNNTTQDSESDYDILEEVKKQEDQDVILRLDELHPILDSEAPQSANLSVDNSDAASKNTFQDSESYYDSVEEKGKKQENEDIILMLDELHPALDSKAPQPAHLSVDNSDAASSNTTQDSESDYDSVEEEADKQEVEEAQQERDDTSEAVVIWTEDDQKNLMDLVSSELERNRRLEDLIAKRRAWNFLGFHAKKNLIGLDSNDRMPSIGNLSRVHYHSPSISAPTRNPFDLPFDMEETTGLPPFPSSAPALQPRRNPFDLSLDRDEESDSLARETMNHQKFALASQREMYRQHESFTLGASFYGDCKEESLDSLLKPHSVHKCNSNLSVDQDNHKGRLEESNLDNRVISPENHIEPVEQDSQSSNVVDSVDEHEDLDGGHAIQLKSSTVAKENHQAADAFGAAEMEITQTRQGEPRSSDSQAGSLDVIEERYYDSNSSFSEAYETSSGSMLSVPADSDITSASERLVDSQPVGPVYNSLLHAGKEFSSGSLVASDVQLGSSELASSSTVHDKVSSPDSGFVFDRGSMDQKLSSSTTELWVTPPSFASVVEIESRSREVTEISKRDVIRVGLSVIHEGFGHPISHVLPGVTYPSCLSVDLGNNIAVEVDVMTNTAASSNPSESTLPYAAQEMPVFHHSEKGDLKDSDVVISDMSPISTNIPEDIRVGKELEHIGKTKNIKKLVSVFQSSEKAGVKESDAVTPFVSPFLMNNREDFRVRKKHESMVDPSAYPSSLSGMQQIEEHEIEEHEVGLSGEGDTLLPKSSSSFKIGKIKNMRKLMHGFHHFEKGGLKASNVVTSGMSKIPTNSLEVFRVRKESESVTDQSANASILSGLQQIEEHDLALSGQGDKVVPKSSSSLKIPKIKNIKKLMPVFQQSDKARMKDFDVPEDFRITKDNENIIAPVANSSSLSGLQQIDEREVSLTGDGDKPVSKSSSSSSKIGKINKNVKKLMPVFKLSEKAGPRVSDVATSQTSLIQTNYRSENVTVGKENDPPTNSSSLSGLQQIEGDKLGADVTKSNSFFKVGKVKNIKKFW